MTIVKFLFILIVGVMIPWDLYAKTSWEGDAVLDGLVAEALERNNDIKAMEVSIQGLRSKAVYEGSLADPQVGFAVSNFPLDSWNFKDEAMTQKQIFVAQTFPWSGKRGLKSRSVELESDMMALRLKARKLSMARAVAGFYYDLGMASRSLEFNRDATRLIEKMIPVAQARYASGKGSRQDVLMAQIELDKRSNERLDLESRYRQTESRINGLLNRDTPVAIPHPSVPQFPDFYKDTRLWVDRALEANPELAILRLEMAQGETGKALSEKATYPDVTVRLTYGQRDDDPLGKSRTDFVSLGASLPIPLWKHQRQDKDLAFKEATLRSADHRLRDLYARIPHDVERLSVDLDATAKRHDVYVKRLIPSARDLAQSFQADYEVGKAGFGPMITAQINALSMELSADTLLFELAKKWAELDELLGNMMDKNQGKDHDTDVQN